MPQRNKFKWYNNVRRYRDKAGRFVSEPRVTGYVEKTVQNFGESLYLRTLRLTEDFSSQNFVTWATEARREIKNMHNSVTIIALGGKKAAMQFSTQNANVWREAENAVSHQLRYFDRFMLQTISGMIPVDKGFANRASLYAAAGFSTFENAKRLRELVAGMNEEMRELGAVMTEHCEDCLIEASKGWQPTGTLRRIGDSKCIVRCKCRFKFRKTNAAVT